MIAPLPFWFGQCALAWLVVEKHNWQRFSEACPLCMQTCLQAFASPKQAANMDALFQHVCCFLNFFCLRSILLFNMFAKECMWCLTLMYLDVARMVWFLDSQHPPAFIPIQFTYTWFLTAKHWHSCCMALLVLCAGAASLLLHAAAISAKIWWASSTHTSLAALVCEPYKLQSLWSKHSWQHIYLAQFLSMTCFFANQFI